MQNNLNNHSFVYAPRRVFTRATLYRLLLGYINQTVTKLTTLNVGSSCHEFGILSFIGSTTSSVHYITGALATAFGVPSFNGSIPMRQNSSPLRRHKSTSIVATSSPLRRHKSTSTVATSSPLQWHKSTSTVAITSPLRQHKTTSSDAISS
jgi:hypothetical protein